MNKKKQKKKEIAKRRAEVKRKKPVKLKGKTMRAKPRPDIQFADRPAFSDVEAPEGFRPISMTQAIMEYAKPIMAYVESGTIKDMNTALQMATLLWNNAISLERGAKESEQIKKDTIKAIKSTLKMNDQKAIEFLDEMLARKSFLFPQDIQPKYHMIMFMRKEVSHLITEFDYSKLTFSKEIIPPDDQDRELVESIHLMDKYIADGTDYDEWEDHYFRMEEQCLEGFEKWLENKGLSQYSEEFSSCVEAYLNFIYRYGHNHPIGLKTVLPIYIEEFFSDFLLRKYMAEDPAEYISWPPALKLFYTFLYEKEYLSNPEPFIIMLDANEPHFMKILRKIF